MKTKLLVRIAAGLLLFFALGHSIGHFTRHDVTDSKAQEVLKAMTDNKFNMFGQMRSYDENYTGMSLNLIITLIVLATMLCILSNYTTHQPHLTKNLLIPIIVCTVGFSLTGFFFFFPIPAFTCLTASALLILATIRLTKQ